MKKFVKEWFLPPKFLEKIIQTKESIFKQHDKSLFDDKLMNTEKGKRCFIIGTGSSIKKQNLKLLKNDIVIGVSGLYNHEDFNIINPKYYILPPIFKSHSKYYSEDKFISYLKDIDTHLSNDTILFLHIGDKKYIDKYKVFKQKTIAWKDYSYWNKGNIDSINLEHMPSVWSVSESAIQSALYLGFDKIYLLGFDHDWFSGLFNYAFDIDKARKHFKESAEEVSKKHHIDSEFQMIRHAQIFNKYKKLYAMKKNIYNANSDENSYVDTFPKVKYEDLFKK